MPELGWAGLGVVPEVDSGFYRKLERDVDPALSRVGKTSGSKFGHVLGKAAAITATGAIGAGFAAFKIGSDAVQQASDLGESLNAISVSYGKQSRAVKGLGKQAATSLGLSNVEFNNLAVRFSAFSRTIAGGDGKKVVTTLDDLTTRASDFASVMNLEVSDAAELFQSGLAGETEPLRKYGIDLSAAAVEAHALKVGITDGKDALTESEKVQARYSLLMQQTSQAQGDFANTSDSLANRQRILNARWDDAQAKLGNALLPIVEDLTGYLLDKGIPAFEDFGEWFTDKGLPALQDFGGWARDNLFPILQDMAEFGGDAAGFVKDIVEHVNNLPDAAKLAGLAAILAGGGAAKLRGGKGGLLGTAGSALGLAKPVPVFVTNKGFGGTGLGAGGGKVGAAGKVGTAAKAFAPAALIYGGWELGKWLGEREKQQVLDAWKAEVDPGQRHADTKRLLGDPLLGGIGGTAVPDYADALKGANEEHSAFQQFYETIPDKIATGGAGLRIAAGNAKLLGDNYEGMTGPLSNVIDHVGNLKINLDRIPADKSTAVALLGYNPMLDQIKRINRELDWAARPREARLSITKVYSAAGYETQGGIPEGMSNDSRTRSRRRGGGGV